MLEGAVPDVSNKKGRMEREGCRGGRGRGGNVRRRRVERDALTPDLLFHTLLVVVVCFTSCCSLSFSFFVPSFLVDL